MTGAAPGARNLSPKHYEYREETTMKESCPWLSPRSPASPAARRRKTIRTRPITMIVPFAAGGPTDIIARIVGDHMSKTLGQQIVVENVAGAGGTTGITRAAQAAARWLHHHDGPHGHPRRAPAIYPT